MDSRTVDSFVGDGFTFDGTENYTTELALLSLEIGLQSFFATYRSVAGSISLLADENNIDQEFRNHVYNRNYRQLYAETIIHLQHFAELVCKDFLRDIHPLLSVVSISSNAVILHKLLNDEEVDWNSLNTTEFSETLNRLHSLNGAGRLPPKLGFIAQHQYCLSKLNYLRNRIWHRGTFVLRYQAFDKFIVGGVLPFVKEVLALPEYRHHTSPWKTNLACGIDPLSLLMSDAISGNYDIGKFAFLKELLRASLRNPIWHVPENGFGRSGLLQANALTKQHARVKAEAITREGDAHAIRTCPVCGVESLVLYSEVETEGDPIAPDAIWFFTNAVVCTCCSFSIDKGIQNPQVYGIEIDDYWFIIA